MTKTATIKRKRVRQIPAISYVGGILRTTYPKSIDQSQTGTPSSDPLLGNEGRLILYTDDQITDIKNLCCTGQSILGIDKTFNLCDMHVNATCYKQVTVDMQSTGEPPIFMGPLYIHDNSDNETYCNFFYHLKIKLSGTDTSRLVFSTDEEKALVIAITTSFPNSDHMLCKRHLYQNTKQKLVDDSVDKADRQEILDLIYGDNGFCDS